MRKPSFEAVLKFGTALLLIPLLVGCEKAQAAPGKPRPTPVALVNATVAKTTVIQHEAKVTASLNSVTTKIASFDPKDAKVARQTIGDLKSLIAQLKRWAESLLDEEPALNANVQKYVTELGIASKAYDEASRAYADYAEKETEEFFKEEYKDMSARCHEFSMEMTRRQKMLQESMTGILAKLSFVRRSLHFLDRLDDFLDLYPDGDSGEKIKKYVEELNKYINSFNASLKAVKQLSDKITKETDGAK